MCSCIATLRSEKSSSKAPIGQLPPILMVLVLGAASS